MPHAQRWTGPATFTLAVVLGLAGCGDETSAGPTTSTPTRSPSATDGSTTSVETTSPAVTPSPTQLLSTTVRRTGFTIVHDGKEVFGSEVEAIGWIIYGDAGNASWQDPTLGTITVSWDVPEERATGSVSSAFFGDVTGGNLAMGPVSWSSPEFTTDTTVETGAHSLGGVRADAPQKFAVFAVPERPVGTMASLSINLGWPRPILVTYHYLYE